MNARKHRKSRQAKETDRLGPKGTQSGSGPLRWPDANLALPVYRADLNHPVNHAEHGKAVSLVPVHHWADLTARRVGGTALGGPKKPRPGCNAPDMPTSVWSEMAREQMEPHTNRRKQMTTDSRRLMRPGVVAPRSTTQSGCVSVLPSCPPIGQRAASCQRAAL